MEIEPPESLFGLYQGTPLPERGWGYGNSDAGSHDDLPAADRRSVRRRGGDPRLIGETVIHEFGHYFGMSEEEIEEIEERTGAASRSKTTSEVDRMAEEEPGSTFSKPAWAEKPGSSVDAAARPTLPRDRPGPWRADACGSRRACEQLTAVEVDREMAAPSRRGARERGARQAGLSRVRPGCRWRPHGPLRWRATFPTTSPRPSSSRCCARAGAGAPLVDATLMLQREVADRIVAKARQRGLRGAGHPRAAARRRATRARAAARGIPAAARRSTRRSFAAFRPPRGAAWPTRLYSNAWCGRCSRSGARRCRTR